MDLVCECNHYLKVNIGPKGCYVLQVLSLRDPAEKFNNILQNISSTKFMTTCLIPGWNYLQGAVSLDPESTAQY